MENFIGVSVNGKYSDGRYASAELAVKVINFSDGCRSVVIDDRSRALHKFNELEYVSIDFRIVDAHKDLVLLAILKEAVDSLVRENHRQLVPVTLFLPYVPDARADRRFEYGGSHNLKVVANLINAMGFSQVTVLDPHSDVVEGLIDNVSVLKQYHGLRWVMGQVRHALGSDFVLCAPDLGAAKKIEEVAKKLQVDYVQAIKIRDVQTGRIIKSDLLPKEVSTKSVLIVDDICDGGATFVGIAEALRERGFEKIGLYVSHGIFSKGLGVFEGHIDHIYTGNIVGSYVTSQEIGFYPSRRA
ncbi:ribose-phosphate pyrophosphokinase [Vibrio phage JSF12]|uniref:Ribose-phosphate pyrophosphokinase n=2 Tax=Jesfedecavirus TaxID=2560156 RepID=A0A2D0Z8N7_9CAUD|nr:ribose-phosphate pyrophosphokinase [Vibrio phage JSF10]YP_009794755.1 ribose-phosphate pyrophosphokinase [Vibrio phage JSF12]ASV43508.1 ribose-phosphate pyrophosphokinase [Vibrio phage JSF10]ASV43590.1 ribose-phosphate pyrophosphokinase [Vibrio phage JSF12]